MAEDSKAKANIVIKKIKKGGHGHHGGAWKVAYADFVTAMMAFFLLLWLLSSQPQKKLKGISDYFAPTIGIMNMKGIGQDPSIGAGDQNTSQHNKGNDAIMFGANSLGALMRLPEASDSNNEEVEAKNFNSIAQDLYKAIHDNPDIQDMKDSVNIEQTPEGLKIEIYDKSKRPMFVPGTYELEPYTEKLLSVIAKYIKYIPNYIAISGHTSKDAIPNPNALDNFELSAKRANVTRKFLVDGLLDPAQIERIVGKADQEPLDVNHPNDLSNIRISLTLLKNSLVPFQKQSAPSNLLPDTE